MALIRTKRAEQQVILLGVRSIIALFLFARERLLRHRGNRLDSWISSSLSLLELISHQFFSGITRHLTASFKNGHQPRFSHLLF